MQRTHCPDCELMLHAVIMWSDQANLILWPFALEHAVQEIDRLCGRMVLGVRVSELSCRDFVHYQREVSLGRKPTQNIAPGFILKTKSQLAAGDEFAERLTLLGCQQIRELLVGCRQSCGTVFWRSRYNGLTTFGKDLHDVRRLFVTQAQRLRVRGIAQRRVVNNFLTGNQLRQTEQEQNEASVSPKRVRARHGVQEAGCVVCRNRPIIQGLHRDGLTGVGKVRDASIAR